MFYLVIGIYLGIGLIFTMVMWLNFAIHCKKYFQVAIFAVIITLTWGYVFIAFGVGMLGEVTAHLTTKKNPFFSKIPLALYMIMLEKMYQSLYGVRGGSLLGATP